MCFSAFFHRQSAMAEPHTRRRRKKYRKDSQSSNSSWLSISFTIPTIPTSLLNTLVCLCAGREAKYMFERKSTLQYLQSLPDVEGPIYENTAEWANAVGGNVVAHRVVKPSLIEPWKDAGFGITFRCRHDRQLSTESNDSLSYCDHHDDALFNSAFVSANVEHSIRTQSQTSSNKSSPSVTHSSPVITVRVTPPTSGTEFPPIPSYQLLEIKTIPETLHFLKKYPSPSLSFGPKKLNPSIDAPRTANGRPVINFDSLMPVEIKTYRHYLKPKKHFEKESYAIDKIRPLETQKSHFPPIKAQPSSETTKFNLQFSQIWDRPAYYTTIMDPRDPTSQYLRATEEAAGKTVIRPNLLRLCKTPNPARANMQEFLTLNNRPMDKKAEDLLKQHEARQKALQEAQARDRAETKVLQERAQLWKVNQRQMQRGGFPVRPSQGRRNTGGKLVMTAQQEQAEIAKRANAVYDKAEAAKANKIAPLMERGKTKRRTSPVKSDDPAGKPTRSNAAATRASSAANLKHRKSSSTDIQRAIEEARKVRETTEEISAFSHHFTHQQKRIAQISDEKYQFVQQKIEEKMAAHSHSKRGRAQEAKPNLLPEEVPQRIGTQKALVAINRYIVEACAEEDAMEKRIALRKEAENAAEQDAKRKVIEMKRAEAKSAEQKRVEKALADAIIAKQKAAQPKAECKSVSWADECAIVTDSEAEEDFDPSCFVEQPTS